MADSDSDWDAMYENAGKIGTTTSSKAPAAKSQAPAATNTKADDWDTMYANAGKVGGTVTAPQQTPQTSPEKPGILQTAWEGIKGLASPFIPSSEPQQPHGFGDTVKNALTDAIPGASLAKMASSAWKASQPYSNQVIPSAKQAFKSGNLDDYITAAKNLVGGLPIVGPMMAGAGDEFGTALAGAYNPNSGKVERDPLAVAHSVGKVVGTALSIGAPESVGEAAGKGLDLVDKGASTVSKVLPDSLGDLVNTVKNKLPVSVGGGIVTDADREKAWTSGLRPGANIPTWQKSVKIAPDLIKDAESGFGRPIESVHDLLPQVDHMGNIQGPGAIGIAKSKLYNTRDQLLQKAGSQGAMVDGNAIADAKIQSISRRQQILDPEGTQKTIDNINSTYRKNFSLQDAEAMKEGAQAENNAFFAKSAPGQSSLLKGDPHVASLNAEQGAWKKGLEKATNDTTVAPEDSGALKQINQQLGALTDFEKASWARKNVLDRQSVNSLPQSLTRIGAAGDVLKSAGDLKFGTAAMGVGKVLFADHLAEAFGTNGLIKRAVSSHDLSGFNPIGISEGPSVEPYSSQFSKQAQALRQTVHKEVGPDGQVVKTPTDLGQGQTTPSEPINPARQSGVKQSIPDTQAGNPDVTPDGKGLRERTAAARNVTARSIPKMGQGITSKVPGNMRPLPSQATNFHPGTPEFAAMQQKLRQRGAQ